MPLYTYTTLNDPLAPAPSTFPPGVGGWRAARLA